MEMIPMNSKEFPEFPEKYYRENWAREPKPDDSEEVLAILGIVRKARHDRERAALERQWAFLSFINKGFDHSFHFDDALNILIIVRHCLGDENWALFRCIDLVEWEKKPYPFIKTIIKLMEAKGVDSCLEAYKKGVSLEDLIA